ILHSNTTKSGDLSRSPKKSSLFFLTVYHPKIKHHTFIAFSALLTSLKNPLKEIVFTLGYTHNYSRSLSTNCKVGAFQRWGVDALSRFQPSSARLTTNLELVQTRGI
ncbi:hypothetical protein P154DRAFT_451153, partial [Amniculicola lignicola CBS 123094]